tara:strand:- start:337 stop:732 length:396 start_codon:yes stop_codon:yes gene_type:complete
MYSKDMLIGIILSSFVLEIRINKDKKLAIGYRTTVSLVARGNLEWLNAIKRSLLQHEITSKLNTKESKNRPSPLLRISSIKNLTKVKTLLKDLPSRNFKTNQFNELVDLIANKRHLTLNGFDTILKLKGVI